MIAPDSAADLRAERRFDILAAVLIGVIAVMASILALMQMNASQAANRADMQSARLAADISTRISVSEQALDSKFGLQQSALALGMESLARRIAGLDMTDDAAAAVGAAENSAYERLAAALTQTSATTGGPPIDSYTAGLLNSTTEELQALLTEQNRQVDVADIASAREQRAVLGLSFVALAGVLTGLAAVLREGLSGWISLWAAAAMTVASGVLAVLAFL
jgi:hypothetical protein